MTVQLAVTFSSLLVEYENLVTLYQFGYYFANNFCAFHYGSTYGYVTVVVYQKNLVKFYCRTGFCFLHVVYEQLFASFCFELLTVDFYNCVHLIYNVKLAPAGSP